MLDSIEITVQLLKSHFWSEIVRVLAYISGVVRGVIS